MKFDIAHDNLNYHYRLQHSYNIYLNFYRNVYTDAMSRFI